MLLNVIFSSKLKDGVSVIKVFVMWCRKLILWVRILLLIRNMVMVLVIDKNFMSVGVVVSMKWLFSCCVVLKEFVNDLCNR